MARVLFEGVTKRFGDVVAVRDLTLEVADGEFLVLVGPSGCGKSTVLRLLAGLEQPTAGSIYIGERRVNDVEPRHRDIAMVFQSYALYPHMSVRDNIAFALKLRRRPRAEITGQVGQTAASLNLGTLLQRRPKALSGGQRQRVALARAIVRNPAAFLMDEPLSNLDAKLRVQTRAEIITLQRRLRATTIYVTHDQVEAMTMGDRIAVMQEGVLQQLDSPQRLYDEPANVFVAGFIGSPGMNFLDAMLSRDDGQLCLVGDGWQIPVSAASQIEDGELIVGIRPEDIKVHLAPPAEAPGSVAGEVRIVEHLGSETLVHAQVGTQVVVARTEPRLPIRVGDLVWLGLPLTRVHLFHRATGKRQGLASS